MIKDASATDFELLNADLENYFSNTIIPQLFVDGNLKLRKFTPPAMKQFNLTTADIGKSVGDLADNIRFAGITDNILQVIHSGSLLEKEIQTTDRRWYQMNILPYIVKQTGKTNGVIMTFVDITARIHDLKELERLISDHQLLIDTISHDIKNPITNIVLALELVRSVQPLSPDVEAGIDIIDRATTRIKGMIEELNNRGKESKLQNAEAELLNIENVLEDVFIALTTQLQDSQTVIKTDIRLSEITFSRRKLRSVFYNLISNAVKYRAGERGCEIMISTFREKDTIVLRVTDNGIGITSENYDLIFSKYFRLPSAAEGSGVGLYLVKEIVRGAGGEITVDSIPGEGSVFTVYLKM